MQKLTALCVRYANKFTQRRCNRLLYFILYLQERIVKENVFSNNGFKICHKLQNSHVEILCASKEKEARVYQGSIVQEVAN